jgi:hypothetical protein
MPIDFKPHGEFAAQLDGRVLVAHVRGTWNIEMHHASMLQSAALVSQLDADGEPWGTVVVVHDTLVSCLDVLEAGRDAVSARPSTSKLVALAWVMDPSIEGYSLLLPTYQDLYKGLLATEVFDDLDAARLWMGQVLDA